MTDAELDALDRLCQQATTFQEWYDGEKLLGYSLTPAEMTEMMAARTALPQLVAEVRRLRALDICEVCRCRLEHPQPCHCWNDE